MNWYEKHLGDWAKKTSHLTLVEEGAYNRLVDWCYAHERPLPPAMRDVCRAARCTTPQDRKTVERVVHEFFELHDDGWHQPRVDRTIAQYLREAPARNVKRASAKERQQRARERRVFFFEALRAVGVVPSIKATMAELDNLCKEHGVTPRVTGDVTRDERVTTHGNHPPTTINSATRCDVTSVTPSRAGSACRQMRIAGVQDVNPSHPTLLRLLEAGATEDELRYAAAEASAKRKGFAYALAVVEGRRNDAANQIGPGRPLEGRTSRAEDQVKALAPSVASKRSEAVLSPPFSTPEVLP